MIYFIIYRTGNIMDHIAGVRVTKIDIKQTDKKILLKATF